MFWFNNEEKRKRMDFIQSFVPTSKAQLIQVSMWYHRGDIEKAQEMVDFYTKNMPNLPDQDPQPLTFMQQAKDSAKGLFGWIKENQNDIMNGYNFIQTLIQNRGVIQNVGSEVVEEALEPINE